MIIKKLLKEYDYFYYGLIVSLTRNEVERDIWERLYKEEGEVFEPEKISYIFEEKIRQRKPMNSKKYFKDRHFNYFQYHTFDTTDTLMAGRLLESYQKYDSILVGTHTWYKYDRKKATKEKLNYCKEFTKYDVPIEIEKQISYDEIYPICWSKAIKLAKKQGIREKFPKLQAPEGYPNEKQPQENAFWIVSDKYKTIKINAYTGENE